MPLPQAGESSPSTETSGKSDNDNGNLAPSEKSPSPHNPQANKTCAPLFKDHAEKQLVQQNNDASIASYRKALHNTDPKDESSIRTLYFDLSKVHRDQEDRDSHYDLFEEIRSKFGAQDPLLNSVKGHMELAYKRDISPATLFSEPFDVWFQKKESTKKT